MEILRACTFGLAVAPAVAAAQEGAPPLAPAVGGAPSADPRRIDELWTRAISAANTSRLGEAAELFEAAWELTKDSAFLCRRGFVLARAGRRGEAVESLSACLDGLPAGRSAEERAKAESQVAQLRPLVGSVAVETNVLGAEIVIDGRVVRATSPARPVFVDPGKHAVEVRTAGWRSDPQIVEVKAGAASVATFMLSAAAPAAASSEVGASGAGAAPQGEGEGPGEADSYADSSRRYAVLGLGALGIASGFGAGIASFLESAEKRQMSKDLDAKIHEIGGEHPCTRPLNLGNCEQIRGLDDDADILIGVGVGATIVGVVATGAVAYELFRPVAARPPGELRAAISPLPGGAVAMVRGAF